jgi:hypothetical protein
VPEPNSFNAVVLLLCHRGELGGARGFSKEEAMTEAEHSKLCKEPVHGTGKVANQPFAYDSWANFSKLKNAEVVQGSSTPQVMVLRVQKSKPHRYILTEHGKKMAEAIHEWAHSWNTLEEGGKGDPCKCKKISMSKIEASRQENVRKIAKQLDQYDLSSLSKGATSKASEALPSTPVTPSMPPHLCQDSSSDNAAQGSRKRKRQTLGSPVKIPAVFTIPDSPSPQSRPAPQNKRSKRSPFPHSMDVPPCVKSSSTCNNSASSFNVSWDGSLSGLLATSQSESWKTVKSCATSQDQSKLKKVCLFGKPPYDNGVDLTADSEDDNSDDGVDDEVAAEKEGYRSQSDDSNGNGPSTPVYEEIWPKHASLSEENRNAHHKEGGGYKVIDIVDLVSDDE